MAWNWLGAGIVAAAVIGCASGPSELEVSTRAAAVLKESFRANGQAGLDRLEQDETQRLCTLYANKPLPNDVAEMIEKLNMASIKWPANAKWTGDWKDGEKIAQEGRGKQFSDDPKGPIGGNCYACHQISPQEVSYGTIGPSLLGFGRLRGYTDDTRKYAYGKIWNADAYNACSNMPRFGHSQILSEQQVKDLVALLTDPASPVNK
jgi:L-cysteine S-thiosulfotransferase